MRIWSGLFGLLAVGLAHAEQQPIKSTLPPSSEITGQLLQLLFGLLLVIAVIFVLAWLVRRIQHSLPVNSNKQVIQLLATQPLGPRERLLLVQVGKEQVLLGLTPGSIEPLHVLQQPVEIEPIAQTSGAQFAGKLKTLLHKQAQMPSQPKDDP